MLIKRIKCPNCGAVLDVKNSKNESLKLITCPQCGAQLRVKFAPPKPAANQQPLDAETFVATPKTQQQGGDTILGKKPSEGHLRPVLSYMGRDYPLNIGENIIGRKAPTSQASVQIDTDDHYMSRQHARISVTSLPDGSKKVVISNFKNKNATAIDGMTLVDDDALILQPGNHILMGNTTIIYNMK